MRSCNRKGVCLMHLCCGFSHCYGQGRELAHGKPHYLHQTDRTDDQHHCHYKISTKWFCNHHVLGYVQHPRTSFLFNAPKTSSRELILVVSASCTKLHDLVHDTRRLRRTRFPDRRTWWPPSRDTHMHEIAKARTSGSGSSLQEKPLAHCIHDVWLGRPRQYPFSMTSGLYAFAAASYRDTKTMLAEKA